MNIFNNPMTLDPARFYSVLSHPMRLRILVLLKQEKELCVCELTQALGLSQPVISRHLAQLKQAEILLDRRQGVWVFYSINTALPEWTRKLIKVTTKGIASSEPYQQDLLNLTSMSNRPTNCS
jgi:ArsR family transcriptional regulator